jgi:hypothetical protein
MPPAILAPSLSQTRTIEHYRLSLDKLQKSLPKSTQHYLNKTKFPAFRADQGVESSAVALQSAIEEMIQTRKEFTADPKRANKAKDTAVRWFRATYPFAEVFLIIAKEGSAVQFPPHLSLISRFPFLTLMDFLWEVYWSY